MNIFNLTNTRAGSDKYGRCEVCKANADTVYHLVVYQIKPISNLDRIFYHHDVFGHKSCLSSQTSHSWGNQ